MIENRMVIGEPSPGMSGHEQALEEQQERECEDEIVQAILKGRDPEFWGDYCGDISEAAAGMLRAFNDKDSIIATWDNSAKAYAVFRDFCEKVEGFAKDRARFRLDGCHDAGDVEDLTDRYARMR